MILEAFADDLAAACGLADDRAVLRITATYQPVGGEGSKVFPPTYPVRDGGDPYVKETRVVGGAPREDVLLDSFASQANRAEEALLRAVRSGLVAVPLMELHHKGSVELVLTSLEFPHRYADAYARDSLIDGVKFDRTSLGQDLLAASMDDVTAVYANDPGSLVFGAWNSHRKGRQQKFPRIYVSELIGWDPIVGARKAGRMDPLNLVGSVRAGEEGWEYSSVGEKGAKKVAGEKLSEIGHGNVAPNPQHGGVTITSATRMATISLAGLDRLGFGSASPAAAVAARTVLAAYALLADRLAFGGPSLWLRSGCELVLQEERLEWISRGGGAEGFALGRRDAVALFDIVVQRAAKEGMQMSTEPVVLTPSPSLAKAIDFSLTKAETAGE